VIVTKVFHKGQSQNIYRRNEKRETTTSLGFLAPSLTGLCLFVLLPFLDAMRRSFFSALGGKHVGLRNYGLVFENEAFRLASANTVRFTLWCIPLLLVLSLILALAVHAAADSSGVLKTGFLLPMAIPAASMVLLWRVLFHQNGLVNRLFELMGYAGLNWFASDRAFTVLIASYLWKNCGYNMVLWLSALYGIAPELYEAAQVDGAGRFRQFFHITLPGLRPHLFTVTVLSLLGSFKVFREAYLLMGDYPHESIYMLQHLFNNWFMTLDVDKLCAAASIMAALMFAAILLLQKTVDREDV
jgi:multiple sugar transport system permease protein